MEDTHPFPEFVLETSALGRRKLSKFDLRPDQPQLQVLKGDLDLDGLRKVSFKGNLSPAGKHAWNLVAELGATDVQPCTITLEPVTTRIEATVERRFVAEMPEFAKEDEEDEFGGTAVLDDDTLEPLENTIDLWRVLTEALALELPDYPRIEGAELGELNVTEPGKTALDADTVKPFAGLAAFKDKLEGKE